MIKVGTIGDLHLDKSRIKNVVGDNSTDLMLDSVDKTLKYFHEQKVDFVVFLGDLSDEPSLSDLSELKLMRLLSKWDTKLKIHIILGNHDIEQENVHSLCKIEFLANKFWKTIKVHTSYDTLELRDTTFEFLPYPVKKGKVKGSICFGHFEISGATGDNGRTIKSSHEVKSSQTYILGHLHTKQKVGKHYFPGTLYQTSFGENSDKGFGLFEIKKGKITNPNSCLVSEKPSFTFVNLELHKQKELDNIKEIIKDDTFYKIFIKSNLEVPSNLTIIYKNIVEIIPFKDKKDLNQLVNLEQSVENIAYSVTDNLDEFLKARNHSPEQIEKAKQHVAKAIEQL